VQMRSTLASAMGLMLALNIPATLGLIVLAEPIIALIFEHGRFTSRDTAATALALQYYAIGLVGYSIVRIVSPAFYALHKSRIPVIASISSVIANVLLNLILVKVMGYAGLALGTSLAAILNATIQFVWLRRELGGIQAGQVAVTFAKVLAAAIPMAAAAWFSQMWLLGFFPGDAIALRALRVLASIVIALAVLSASAWVLRVREFEDAYDLVGRRLGRLRR